MTFFSVSPILVKMPTSTSVEGNVEETDNIFEPEQLISHMHGMLEQEIIQQHRKFVLPRQYEILWCSKLGEFSLLADYLWNLWTNFNEKFGMNIGDINTIGIQQLLYTCHCCA